MAFLEDGDLVEKKCYSVDWKIYPASHFGNLQMRKRLYCVAFLPHKMTVPFKWPEAMHNKKVVLTDILEPPDWSEEACRLPPCGQKNSKGPNRERELVERAVAKSKVASQKKWAKALKVCKATFGAGSTMLKKRVVKNTQEFVFEICAQLRGRCGGAI